MDNVEAYADLVQEALQDGSVRTKDDLQRLKQKIARATKINVPRDSELIRVLPEDVVEKHIAILRKKPMRTGSGVAVLAVMSSPAVCPHGKCVYCPGGPEVDSPQSYTGFEPSTMRAKRWSYDPYLIARSRLGQLERNGHAVDKIDVIIQGGTFPAREDAYQEWFVAGIYAGCNAGADPEPEDAWTTLEEWESWDAETRDAELRRVMEENESTKCRVIGLTIETKPDWCLTEHIDGMLRFGCTRIELGIQTLDEETTKFTNRGHTVQDSADSLRIARDAGFKVCVHMMPGLPRPKVVPGPAPGAEGAKREETEHMTIMPDPAMDRIDMERLFAEQEWRPDMLKIYPTLVVHEGETPLKKWWKEGKYVPYDTAQAAEVVADAFRHIPAWCRVQRVDRDIPTTHVDAGVQNSNLRQIAEAKAADEGIAVRDMRSREVHRNESDADGFELVRRDYDASGGKEVFLSWEDPSQGAIAGFVRLRLVGPNPHRVEFQHDNGAAVIRELKVYGMSKSLGNHDDEAGAFQHQGLGGKLLSAAEAIAFTEWNAGRLVVIAGVGVKAYYRKKGYLDVGPYVAMEQPAYVEAVA